MAHAGDVAERAAFKVDLDGDAFRAASRSA
jgi:hypothetical protein